MRRVLTLAVTTALLIGAAPAVASASAPCSGSTTAYTNGGHEVYMDRFRALSPREESQVTKQMNCASAPLRLRFRAQEDR